MYGSGLTYAHDTHHTYMGWGATPKSCVGFVCLNSHLCCSGNKQRQVHYPRTNFANYKQKASDSISQSHLKRQTNKTNSRNHQPNKQKCSYELKRIHICGVHLGLLPQTSLSGTCFPSLSLLTLVRLLPRGDLGLYLYLYLFYRAYMFNSYKICARILICMICGLCLHIRFLQDLCTIYVFFLSDLYGLWLVPAYSIPIGYVHNLCVLPF